MIHEHLLNTAPSGMITGEDFVWLLRRLVADGAQPLPMEWMSADDDTVTQRLMKLKDSLDVNDSGTLSWREFLVAAAVPSYPNTADMLEMRKAFNAADADGDLRVTMEEYKTVPLWFEGNSKLDDARKDAIKGLMYQLFTVPDPSQPDDDDVRLFDFLACLLHCCADEQQEQGVARAFKMIANGDAPLKREEVARIATAGVGVLDDAQVAALGQVFSGKADTARIQLEPIMAEPHGHAMMMSQRVYSRKHIY
jgi:Ca2+-binding EF-hand superfamily protein